jgi:BppU N-terminal domain
MDDGAVVDLTGTTVQIAVKKPSGMTVFQNCDVTDATTGSCEVVLNNQAYLEIGAHSAELVLTSGDVVSISRSFTYTSLDAILDDATLTSENDWQTFQDILLNADKRPLLGSGSPNNIAMPEYQGQQYLDTAAMTMYFASTVAIDGWRSIGTGGGTGGGTTTGSTYWADILDKPTVFTPAAHTHLWNDITDKPVTFTPAYHTHLWADITDKPTEFPPAPHTHDEYLTSTEADGLYQALGVVPAHTHLWADITDKPTTFTPPTATGATLGGVIVGNGLHMVGGYITVRDGLGIKTNATTYAVDVDKPTTDTWYVKNAPNQTLTLWKGTQAAYDAITTKDANTVYFITT